jgi:hypothetical protein
MAACVPGLLQRPKAALGFGLQVSSIPTWREQPIANQHLGTARSLPSGVDCRSHARTITGTT